MGMDIEKENSQQLLHRKETPRRRKRSLNNQFPAESQTLAPSLIKATLLLLLYLSVGATCFYVFRSKIQGNKSNGIIDILYYCVVTMTTVGYGDLVPDAPLTKLLACAFVFAGMALVSLLLTNAADYLVEKQETLLFRALHQGDDAGGNRRIKYKCVMISIILLLLMALGTVVLKFVEGKDALDAFYCVCVTITTLGYGDESFSTRGGRAFAVFWILTSTVCLGQLFLYVAEHNTETRRRKLVKWVLRRRLTYQDLEAADLNGDGVVEAAEFIVYKLKEMGKISKEDIAMVMEEFEELDVDQSGTISMSDLVLAQSKTDRQAGEGHSTIN